jgi:RNA-binding protein
MTPVITKDDLRQLRALGHHKEPIVQVGKEGVTEGLVIAASRALLDHELVKIRIASEAPEDRETTAAAVAEQTKATLVQVLGRTALLYKRHPSKPKLLVSAAREAKAATTKVKGRNKKKLAPTGKGRPRR